MNNKDDDRAKREIVSILVELHKLCVEYDIPLIFSASFQKNCDPQPDNLSGIVLPRTKKYMEPMQYKLMDNILNLSQDMLEDILESAERQLLDILVKTPTSKLDIN